MAAVAANRSSSPGGHRDRQPHLAGPSALERDPEVIAAVTEATAIRDTRARVHSDIAGPDRMSGLLTGGSFVVALAVWLLVAPPVAFPVVLLAACIAAHAAAASIEFELAAGSAVPTTPVLVVSLFILPPQLVPLVALAGLIIAAYLARLRDPSRRERLPVLAGSAWHAMGPALVFAFAGIRAPALSDAGIYLLAIGAQFAFDAAASWVRNCWGLGVAWRELAHGLGFTFLADLMLAPIGLAAAFAAPGSTGGLLFLAGPILLLAMLQRDRERQIDRTVVLSEAFTESADRARRDVLTGLRNRLAWEEAVAHHGARPNPVGVVLADVDGLKATNDALGHDAGDRLLVAIAHVLLGVTPHEHGAMAARLGGDEFGILLPGALADRAEEVATRLRASLRGDPSPSGPSVSASVGWGLARSGATLSFAFLEADRGVYEDKSRRSVNRR